MLSRLIPSTRSLFPRAFNSSSSLHLFAHRSLVPSSTNALFRSFSTSVTAAPSTPATAPRSVYLTYEPLIKAFDELRVQSASWAPEKKAQVESEIKAAQKSGGDSAALAVTQKYLLQRTTFSDIVQKFGGWYPLLGLATVAGFSKELFLLNEEVLLATNFCFVVGMIYFNYADVILQQFYDDRAAYAKQQKELRELEIDTNKVLIASYEKNPLVYSMLKELKTEYNDLFQKKQKVTFARQRVAAHQAVTKKLNDIHAKELEEASRIRSIIQKAATAYVLDKYAKLPAAQKSLTLDYAIDRFAGGKVDIKKDPIRQLYLEYFKNKEWTKTAQKK